MQHTLQHDFTMVDIGLHSGKPVHMRVYPASPDHGIVFKRVDCKKDNLVAARWDHVVDTRLCTVIANESGVRVGTIEHFMAALRACGVDNAFIEIDAEELPIFDGSSKQFVEAIENVGICAQSQPRRALRVLKDITVKDGKNTVRLSPSSILYMRAVLNLIII